MPSVPHQIVALRKLVEDFHSGLAYLTETDAPLVAAIASHTSAIRELMSTAVRYSGSGVSVSGTVTAGAIIAGSMDLVSAIAGLQSAMSRKQGVLSAGLGLSISGSVISLSRGIDTTVTVDSNNLVTSGAVAAAVAGGTFALPVAGVGKLGAVKVGSGLAITADGTLSAPGEANVITAVKVNGVALGVAGKAVNVPVASPSVFGVVKVGLGLSVSNGVLSLLPITEFVKGVTYGGLSATVESGIAAIPQATSSAYGVVAIGNGLYVLNGVIGTSAEANVITALAAGVASQLCSVSSKTAIVPYATTAAFGVVKVGAGLSVSGGTLTTSAQANVIESLMIGSSALPVASNKSVVIPYGTSSAFGVVKVDGVTLQIDASGVLKVVGGVGGSVSDVRINGSTILSSGVAAIPLATNSAFGVVKIDGQTIQTNSASSLFVPYGTSSAFGVVKIDNATVRLNNASQLYVRSATASQAGIVLPDAVTLSINARGKLYAVFPSHVSDVRIGTTTLVSSGVATVPYGTSTAFGVVKVDGTTIQFDSDTSKIFVPAATSSTYGAVKLGPGLLLDSTTSRVTVDTSTIASVSFVSEILGNINSVLAAVIGE